MNKQFAAKYSCLPLPLVFLWVGLVVSSQRTAIAVQFTPRQPPAAPSQNSNSPNRIQEGAKIGRVELEVVFAPSSPPRNGAQWAKLLSEVGFDRAILRRATADDEIGIEAKMNAGQTMLQVTGGLLRGRLLLPGLDADPTDRKEITDWLQRLKNPELNPAMQPVAFGFTAKELVEVQIQLGKKVAISTRKLSPVDTLSKLQTTSPILLVPSIATSKAVANETKIPMELQGVSVGTALAAFARPRGLVLVPSKTKSGTLQLNLAPAEEPAEYWPIGWPTKKPLIDLAPDVLQQTDIDLRGQTLSEAFALIATKTGVPILLDYNSLVANRIEPEKTRANVRLRNKTWRSVMTALATEQKPTLGIEARIDDSGQPFFWVSRP